MAKRYSREDLLSMLLHGQNDRFARIAEQVGAVLEHDDTPNEAIQKVLDAQGGLIWGSVPSGPLDFLSGLVPDFLRRQDVSDLDPPTDKSEASFWSFLKKPAVLQLLEVLFYRWMFAEDSEVRAIVREELEGQGPMAREAIRRTIWQMVRREPEFRAQLLDELGVEGMIADLREELIGKMIELGRALGTVEPTDEEELMGNWETMFREAGASFRRRVARALALDDESPERRESDKPPGWTLI